MQSHHQKIVDTLRSIKDLPWIDKAGCKEFEEFLKSKKVLRDENVMQHCCAACFIINPKEKKIFLGDHIKAGKWLNGVGGHMDKGESPEETARREFQEELSYTPATDQNFQLFDIVHFENVGRPTCTDHFDFLYLVKFDTLPDFKWDRGEFKEAKWLTFEEALEKQIFPIFRRKLKTVFEYISS